MTDDKIALRELLGKGSDATFLREMIGLPPNASWAENQAEQGAKY